MKRRTTAWLALLLVALAGCRRGLPPNGSVVLTQTPVDMLGEAGPTELDVRYPAGSRVVLVAPPYRAEAVRELSRGLFSAGGPCVSWDGRWVYFSGKRSAGAAWQIYRVASSGGWPERVTDIAGGAMDVAVAAHGELVFSSPVPPRGQLWTGRVPVAIYGQPHNGKPRRFTFGPESAGGATVLRDGRILFVSARPREDRARPAHLCLYAINNDGTEVTAYAGQDDGADEVRRPRELPQGRIAFVASRADEPAALGWAEAVRSAAPFVTRAPLFAFRLPGCVSVESDGGTDLLACVETRGMVGRSMIGRAAVYRLRPDAQRLQAPLFEDVRWNCIEATAVVARGEPAGHTSAVMPAADHGTMLCLNVNESAVAAANGSTAPATQLRIYAAPRTGAPIELGTVPVAADGSVLVRLPIEVPLGFDTLDAGGHVLRHQPPFVWLHAGENRGCIGCHESRNHAPRNVRPLVTQSEPPRLDLPADFNRRPAL